METCYVEAYQRVKVLKQEYDAKLEKWLGVCNKSSAAAELLHYFKDVANALNKLNAASWELARMLGEEHWIPEDFVVRVLA